MDVRDPLPSSLPERVLQVVLSFVLAAVLATGSSVAAAILDGMVSDSRAFFPLALQRWLSDGLSQDAIDRRIFWRRVLDRLILSLADQQLISGLSLLVTGYIKQSQNLLGIHFTLIVYLGCLSSSSHLAAVLTLRKYFDNHYTIAVLRVRLILLFALALFVSLALTRSFHPFFIPIDYILAPIARLIPAKAYQFLVSLPIVYLFWTAVLELLPGTRIKIIHFIHSKIWLKLPKPNLPHSLYRLRLAASTKRRVGHTSGSCIWYCLFLSPFSIFVIQVLFAALSLGLSLAQKFARSPREPAGLRKRCDLNSSEENAWGFGQILAMLLLLLPLLSAFETYVGM